MEDRIIALDDKAKKKIQLGWVFYDWANSVYPLVITTAIFPIFYEGITKSLFDGKIYLFGFTFINTVLINYVSAFIFLCVSILSPILSGVADHMGNKKFFLQFFCYLGSFSCIGLFFFDPYQPFFGLLCYVLAGIGFWGSLVFYNSYLPDIAKKSEHDKLSARGFSFGYIGSVILLLTCIGITLGHEKLGLASDVAAKISFILTGLWWMGFSQVTYKLLPKITKKANFSSKILSYGYRELQSTYQKLKQTQRLKKFLSAFFVYSMGVQTVMLAAVYFASKGIAWEDDDSKTQGLIVSMLIIQIIAIAGAYILSYLSSKIGNLWAIKVIITFWVLLCVMGFYIYSPFQFYIMASLVGFVMGGTQSLSRSTYAKFLPDNTKDTTAFFSFFDVSEKIGLILGLFAFATIENFTGNIRYSILSMTVFFVLGLVLLLIVPKEEIKPIS